MDHPTHRGHQFSQVGKSGPQTDRIADIAGGRRDLRDIAAIFRFDLVRQHVAARELAPYRSRMQTAQIRQIEQQFLRRRLLERYDLPRISLFYMQQGE